MVDFYLWLWFFSVHMYFAFGITMTLYNARALPHNASSMYACCARTIVPYAIHTLVWTFVHTYTYHLHACHPTLLVCLPSPLVRCLPGLPACFHTLVCSMHLVAIILQFCLPGCCCACTITTVFPYAHLPHDATSVLPTHPLVPMPTIVLASCLFGSTFCGLPAACLPLPVTDATHLCHACLTTAYLFVLPMPLPAVHSQDVTCLLNTPTTLYLCLVLIPTILPMFYYPMCPVTF